MAVTKLELARRLKKARESANLTQEEAAKRIEVSRVTLTQIEGGQRNVSSLELARLAKLYQRSLSSLLEESGSEEEPLEALLRASPELKESPQAFEELRRVIQLAGEVDKLERAISPSPGCIATYSFAEPASFQEAISQGEHAARQERQRLGLGHLPIADVAELIQSQGILARSVELPESISGVCIFLNSGQTVVVVNSRQHKNRRRFSYAHEYAHAVIDRSPGSAIVSGESGEGRLIERRANAFAVEFLMPSEAVRESLDRLSRNSSVAEVSYSYDSETGDPRFPEKQKRQKSHPIDVHDIVYMAMHFNVSPIAVAIRLKKVGLMDGKALDKLKLRLADVRSDNDNADQPHLNERLRWLAREAYRREIITGGKFRELMSLAGLDGAKEFEFVQEFLDG